MSNVLQRSHTIILFCMILLLLPSCQLTTKKDSATKQDSPGESYGEYYLTLQQLSEQQLTAEINKQQASIENQKTKKTQSNYDSQIKLLLLYSLPESPIYNSFNAKALLNAMQSEGNNVVFAHITPNDQAFINLLRDQLNQRLLMRNRLLAQQQAQKKQQQNLTLKLKQQALQQQKKLIEKIQSLEQTIKQLKNIEQAIDKRDQ